MATLATIATLLYAAMISATSCWSRLIIYRKKIVFMQTFATKVMQPFYLLGPLLDQGKWV
jgi:hypothetical protein